MDYTLHLGINPDAVTIGTAFGQPSSYYPMQMALETSGKPAWFTNFQPGDTLQFHIWNLSAETDVTLSSLNFVIGDNTAGSTHDPSDYFLLSGASGQSFDLPISTVSTGAQLLVLQSPYWQESSGGSSPWGSANGNWVLWYNSALSFTFSGSAYGNGPVTIEAGFMVRAKDGGTTRKYVVDPEMIVSEDPDP